MNFIVENWVQITTTIGLIIAWFVDRKKRATDYESQKGDVLTKIQFTYNQFVSDTQTKINDLSTELNTLRTRIVHYEVEIKGLNAANYKCIHYIKSLSKICFTPTTSNMNACSFSFSICIGNKD